MQSDLRADAEHRKFRKMCALVDSGGLTADEIAELKSHLEGCEECREILSQYRALGSRGIRALAGRYPDLHESILWDNASSWKKLLLRLDTENTVVSPSQSKAVRVAAWLQRIRASWLGRRPAKKSSAKPK